MPVRSSCRGKRAATEQKPCFGVTDRSNGLTPQASEYSPKLPSARGNTTAEEAGRLLDGSIRRIRAAGPGNKYFLRYSSNPTDEGTLKRNLHFVNVWLKSEPARKGLHPRTRLLSGEYVHPAAGRCVGRHITHRDLELHSPVTVDGSTSASAALGPVGSIDLINDEVPVHGTRVAEGSKVRAAQPYTTARAVNVRRGIVSTGPQPLHYPPSLLARYLDQTGDRDLSIYGLYGRLVHYPYP